MSCSALMYDQRVFCADEHVWRYVSYMSGFFNGVGRFYSDPFSALGVGHGFYGFFVFAVVLLLLGCVT